MKQNLLEIVKRMLTVIDAENVDDVGETEEAGMCVDIANQVFEELITGERWKHIRSYSLLETKANANELGVPSGTIALDPYNVYYNGTRIQYLEPEEFLAITIARDATESNITAVNGVNVYTDRYPIYFTSDDDETLRFDAYSTTQLVGSASKAIVYKIPTSALTGNTEIFDLPHPVYPAFIKHCMGMAKLILQQDPGGERLVADARRLMARTNRTARLIDKLDDTRKWIVPRRTRNRPYFTYQIS